MSGRTARTNSSLRALRTLEYTLRGSERLVDVDGAVRTACHRRMHRRPQHPLGYKSQEEETRGFRVGAENLPPVSNSSGTKVHLDDGAEARDRRRFLVTAED